MTRGTEAAALAALRDAVLVVLETDAPLTRDTHLVDDLGADSLARVELAEVLELAGWYVDDEALGGLVTVGLLVDHLVAAA